MSEDIGPILEGWPYGEGGNVRKIVGLDGKEKIQIRVVLEGLHGLVQFDCDGRPDGKRPHERAFALDHYEARLRESERDGGAGGTFRLTHEQAAELFEESFVTYQRYIVLLQVGEFERVIRDTAQNMRLFRFVHEHAAEAEDRDRLEKWWPYIIRLYHTARAMLKLSKDDYGEAMQIVGEARRELDTLTPQEDEVFQGELERSRKALDELEGTINERRPLTETDVLEREKNEAIRLEDYERAARLRDQIDELKKDNEEKPTSEA